MRAIQEFPPDAQTQLSKVLRFERLTEQCYYNVLILYLLL